MRNPGTHILHPFFIAFFLFLFFFFSHPCYSQTLPSTKSGEDGGFNESSVAAFKVGVILNLATPVGKVSRICMEMAVSDFYSAHPGYATRLILRTRDSKRDAVTAASAAVDLLKNEQVQAIIGPQTSDEAEFVAELCNKTRVPVVSFSASSPSLSPGKTRYFVRTGLSDSSQANSIAALVSAFGWKQVVPIYEQSEYGAAAVPYLVDAIKEVGAGVPYRCVLPVKATDDYISKELYKLMSMESRVFLVHVSRALGSRLFTKAKEAEMMSQGFAWIMAEGLTTLLGAMDTSIVHDSMQGVLGVKPYVPKSEKLRQFTRRWRREFLKENPDSDIPELNVFGLWAYDTVWALAMAAERVGAADPGYSRPGTVENSNDLAALGVSETGPSLLDSILKTDFTGLSGRFHLVNGQLHAPAFEIVNVNGQKERGIGFWMPGQGLTRRLDVASDKPNSASMADLGPVIWPGESTAVPKGWVDPMIGKKLRILVPGPVDPGFHSFLRAERDSVTNETVVGGYVIEVFEAAVKALPYAVLFEYITLQRNGTSAGNYDYLAQQIYQQKYDALVGDVTITANRSNFVDFTLPYTTSGVSMVVPYKDDRSKNAWIFLKPLTANLWLVSGAFFVFTGAVVWILEHRINDEFRGPPAHQWGTVFYFIFSTLVFSHKEKVMSNLSRVVVVIWVFVVLILQSSYTASLTSMLTVKHLRPTVTELRDLINSGEYIGHLKNSFTRGLLINMGADEKKLRPYRSPQEYKEALSKGSRGGGIGAVVDEIPYLKVFLKDYCSNYTMAGRTIKAGGFGFVFPKGSPLVLDLSRAILNITEGDKMVEIEKRWFGDQSNCPSKDSDLTSDSLSLASFSGLFLITGIASVASFLIFLFSFVYQHRHLLRDAGSGSSPLRRVAAMSRHFDQKDLSSYKFRKEAKDGVGADNGDAMASPYTNRTSTVDTMASPYTDRSRHGDGPASPCTGGSETPYSIYNRTSGGTPPPELASPLQDASTPTTELIGAAVEEISSAEIASSETASSIQMTPIRVKEDVSSSIPS